LLDQSQEGVQCAVKLCGQEKSM